jgi:hypothetical protein
MDLDKKTLITLVVVALVSLVVGGLVGYYAIPRSEGYTHYELQPTDTKLDHSVLALKSNYFISQEYEGVAKAGDNINRYFDKEGYSAPESRTRKLKSSHKEAYSAPSYGLVQFV